MGLGALFPRARVPSRSTTRLPPGRRFVPTSSPKPKISPTNRPGEASRPLSSKAVNLPVHPTSRLQTTRLHLLQIRSRWGSRPNKLPAFAPSHPALPRAQGSPQHRPASPEAAILPPLSATKMASELPARLAAKRWEYNEFGRKQRPDPGT